MTEIKSSTRYIVILGRTYADGSDADYTRVNELQAQYKLTPLSAFGKPYTYQASPVDPTPGFSMTDKPQSVILGRSAAEYFNRMTRLMGGAAPPAPEDGPIIARMAKIGIVPGQPFDPEKLSPAAQDSLKDLPQRALAEIGAHREGLGGRVNGWVVTEGLGRYGSDYMKRAVVAAFGWPANLQKDAVYPFAQVDSTGEILSGAHDLKINPKDGSTTLYVQNRSPGADRESNWLPAPKGDFILMLRMYWPKEGGDSSILNGSWAPPYVQRMN